jgi:hypothetical protein
MPFGICVGQPNIVTAWTRGTKLVSDIAYLYAY